MRHGMNCGDTKQDPSGSVFYVYILVGMDRLLVGTGVQKAQDRMVV